MMDQYLEGDDRDDARQMEELEAERTGRILELLTRVALGQTNYDDAYLLAAELGVRHLWPFRREHAANTEVR